MTRQIFLVLFIVLLILTSIACGQSANLPINTLQPNTPQIQQKTTSKITVVPGVGQKTQIPTTTPKIMAVCNSGGLRLRSGAGMSFPVLAVLADGQIVTLVDTPPQYPSKIAWYKVTANGLTGWVNSHYLDVGCQ